MPGDPTGDVEVVAAMYPPDGLDWAALMADPAEFRRYRDRAEPLLASDFEMLPIQPSASSKTVIVGIEAYLAGMRVVMDGFKRFCFTPESFVPVAGGVIVFVSLEAETFDGPKRFSGRGGALFQLRDGQICRIREFDDRRALLAAGGITVGEARERAIAPAELAET